MLVGFYIPRRPRWDRDPYQKSTARERRYGGLFMVAIPALFLAVAVSHKCFDKAVDSMMYGHHSIVWLYLGFFVVAGGVGGILFVIGPKTPLFISAPVAVLLWAILAWYTWNHLL